MGFDGHFFRSGPTRDVIRTTHVGPNQTADPNGMAESKLCELRGKKLDAAIRFYVVGQPLCVMRRIH